ncbi:cell division protein FtsA [Desulfocucumis palustris]|uniref:cell division protein FtsA n=1 Tax=Desulfocucumis palustris TaxID=1898651 RepID=UPI001E554FF7|nr:cell division FtsA domain-containing protein [Desulfocucumis palustris]
MLLEPGKSELIDNDTVFALDIGTRSVIGILAKQNGDGLEVLAQHITEHESRAVYDGQIHHIGKVVEAVSRVKSALENKLGVKLTGVAIAAAGRSLRTKMVRVEQDIDSGLEIDHLLCRALENDGIKKAHSELKNEMGEEAGDFYCVGYSVVSYFLNGYSMANLEGHRGSKIAVEVLATFLPVSVVNSLYSVLARAGLQPVSLTLEPIAAAAAVIPDSFRLLNLALIDTGAGTSDIAISRDGAIVAYGMVPLAGDEITEAVAECCLADFNTAEKIKRQLMSGGDIVYTDVVGIETSVSRDSILEQIEPVLEEITGRVAQEIIRLNGGVSPKSVFCVGGGGQVPGFTDKIAEKLGLEKQRVRLRGRDSVSGLLVENDEINGPDGVTVAGIARVAMERVGHDFITITVNGRENRLLYSREITVYDAMGLIEYSAMDLVGKNGSDLTVIVNGEKRVIYGGLRRPAEIMVNGRQASIKTVLKNGDSIEITRAENGVDATARAGVFTEGHGSISIYCEDQVETLEPEIIINGMPGTPETELKNGDEISIQAVETAGQLARLKNIDVFSHDIYVNNSPANSEYLLKDGDRLEFKKKDLSEVTKGDGFQASGLSDGIRVSVNGRDIVLVGKSSYLFVDIFNHIDIDLAQIGSGSRVKLALNGSQAGYTDPLKDGDVVEISFI